MNDFYLDEWLTSALSKKSYFVKRIQDSYTEPKDAELLFSKCQVNDLDQFYKFQSNGYNVIECSVNLIKIVDKKFDFQSDKTLRLAKISDKDGIKKIAKESFINDRFHSDPKISNKVASRLKEEWVDNFFKGRRGDEMIVAYEKDEILGFILLIYANDFAVIDLIAVSQRHRRLGIAKKMIQFLFLLAREKFKFINVGTQLNNLSALNLYLSLGFEINDAKYTLHKHC